MLVADQRGLGDQWIVFELVFNGLRGDQLAAGGLQQLLLAVGDEEEAVRVNAGDVAGAEEALRGRSTRRWPPASASSRQKTEGPRTSNSPSSSSLRSRLAMGLPAAPMRWVRGVLRAISGEVSVRP